MHAHRLLTGHAAPRAVVLQRLKVHVAHRAAGGALAHARPGPQHDVARLQRTVRRDHLRRAFFRDAPVDHRLHDPASRLRADERAPVRAVAVIHDVHRARPRARRALKRQIHLVAAGVAVVPEFVLRLHEHTRRRAAQNAGERVPFDGRAGRLAGPRVDVQNQRRARARDVVHGNGHRVRARARQNTA